jgi:hypothetical protein
VHAAESLKKGDQNSFRTDLNTFYDHSKIESGLIMNCKGVPSINSDHAPRDLSTDHVAFYATAGDEPSEPPSTSSFWQCSLMHYREGFQVSPCGAATHVFCRVGCRAYFLAWKKDGTLEEFVQKPFGECPSDGWEVEMVPVPAGSML